MFSCLIWVINDKFVIFNFFNTFLSSQSLAWQCLNSRKYMIVTTNISNIFTAFNFWFYLVVAIIFFKLKLFFFSSNIVFQFSVSLLASYSSLFGYLSLGFLSRNFISPENIHSLFLGWRIFLMYWLSGFL